MAQQSNMDCPFCSYSSDSEYQIMLHLETRHAEGDSPFVVKEDVDVNAVLSALSDDEKDEAVRYANCPIGSCGEILLLTDLDSHLRLHDVADPKADIRSSVSSSNQSRDSQGSGFGPKLSHALRGLDDDGDHSQPLVEISNGKSHKQEKAKAAWKGMLKMPETKIKPAVVVASSGAVKVTKRRLGKSELGPYYKEKQMPSWLVTLLETEDGRVKTINKFGSDGKTRKTKTTTNHQSGIVPVIEQLLEQDPLTEYAYLCHPIVDHVSKLKKEGGFCGYRNIQMLTSWIVGTKSQGFEHFRGSAPTIFEIQDWIENAWDIGINSSGRDETGGIRGTRKYIGTPDAQAMFLSLGIAVDAQAYKTPAAGPPADQTLLRVIENYFKAGTLGSRERIRNTSLPPIYFQQPGHSMTIVGFEKKRDGSSNLLVFDPMFHDASSVVKLIDRKFTNKTPADLLKAYRRDSKYLRKYKEFETLKLTPPDLYRS